MNQKNEESDSGFPNSPEYFQSAFGVDANLIKKVKDLIEKMISFTDSILVTHFKLHIPETHKFPKSNRLLNRFVSMLAESLDQNKKYYTIFWVRTKEDYSQKQCYNLVVMMDSYYVNQSESLMYLCQFLWSNALYLNHGTQGIFSVPMGLFSPNSFLLFKNDALYECSLFMALEKVAMMLENIDFDRDENVDGYGLSSIYL